MPSTTNVWGVWITSTTALLNGGRTLSLECRLADGWSKHTRTYCFSERLLMDWKFDNRCSVSVSVFPRPSGLFDGAKEWPTIEARNELTCGIRYSVKMGKMGVR